jgi:DNA-binding transcriptional LysR family regulator
VPWQQFRDLDQAPADCDVEAIRNQVDLAAICGGIRIAVSPSQTGGLLREVLRYFRESFPYVATTLTEGSPSKWRQAVATGSLDVAFVAGIETTLGCQVRELWREAVLVALPEARTLAEQGAIEWDDIRAETFVVSHRHGAAMEECLIAR